MPALIIRSQEDASEVKRFNTTGKSERQIERLENGIMINLDHDRFYIDQED